MVYDWEGKEETMLDLYIHKGKSLEEVMEWFKANQAFAPSKRAFQSQIKKWNFPSKHVPAHLDTSLVDRVRQLWAQNLSQKDMLGTLHEEGFQDLTERDLTRIREKEGLKLRVNNVRPTPRSDKSSVPSKRKRNAQSGKDHTIDQPPQAEDESPIPHDEGHQETTTPVMTAQDEPLTDLTEEVVQKRQAWHQKLQAESLERLEKRTRRRRTKVYAGLPPDPPAPPRFPSETTLEEAKAILQLDKTTYTSIRATFEGICRQNNVIKKTEAGHDKWQAIKNQLIDEFQPIQPLFRVADQQQLDHHYLALEMICNDVTKKLRTMKSRVTIADAKNVLGLNPEEGRQIKAAFHKILKADHFTSKLEAGPEHWQELKQRWINDSPLLQSILAPGEMDPLHVQKVKAVEHLCRDVMKRLRDSQTKEEKARKASGLPAQSASPQPTTTTAQTPAANTYQHSRSSQQPTASQGATYDDISTLASQALANAQLPLSPPPAVQYQQHIHPSISYNSQIDPTLLSTAANIPGCQRQQQPSSGVAGFPPTPIYFRLSSVSQVKTPPTIWVETLANPTVSAVRQLAVANRPYSKLRVVRIEGMIKAQGSESKLTIEDDDELMAYLQHVKGATPTFVVGIRYDV
ncbi:MAG: hypothetical protein Q9166_002378 [cf. Caloplaca sp. 2 TL-2023]